MADVVQVLVDALCQQGTASRCTQFLSEYPDVTQQLIWLVFFPSVFILIFVYILAQGLSQQLGDAHKKFQALLAVAFYLFIIFQGWYHMALAISRFWFISVILISGFFVLIHRMGGFGGGSSGNGGGRGGQPRHIGSIGGEASSYLSKRLVGKITGKEKELIKDIARELDTLESLAQRIHKSKGGNDARGAAALFEEFRAQRRYVEEKMRELDNLVKMGGFKVDPSISRKLSDFEKRYNDAVRKSSKEFEQSL